MKQNLCAFLITFFIFYAFPVFADDPVNEPLKEISYYGPNGDVLKVKIVCKERHYDNAKVRSCKNVNAVQSVVSIRLNKDGKPGEYYAFMNFDTGKKDEKGNPIYRYQGCHVYKGISATVKPDIFKVAITFRKPDDPQGPTDVPRCCKLMTQEDENNDTENEC